MHVEDFTKHPQNIGEGLKELLIRVLREVFCEKATLFTGKNLQSFSPYLSKVAALTCNCSWRKIPCQVFSECFLNVFRKACVSNTWKLLLLEERIAAQKMKFFNGNFFNLLRCWSHLLKESLMVNFNFYVVTVVCAKSCLTYSFSDSEQHFL